MKTLLLITLSIFLLCTITGCTGGMSAEFKDDYNSFVEAADRLDGLGVNDISYAEFLGQIEEVQTHYKKLAAYKWPAQFSTSYASFASAVKSLNLVKEVWDVYDKGSGSWRCSLDRDVGNNVALTLGIQDRLEDTDESALKWLRSQTCDVIINELMQNFSTHYTAGKNEMENN